MEKLRFLVFAKYSRSTLRGIAVTKHSSEHL